MYINLIKKKKMKTVILAGGKGTRISEKTKKIPKPMIKVGGIPLLLHIINIYKSYGHNEFIICAGYKSNIIKNYFNKKKFKSKITVVNTGLNTGTAGRILKIQKYLYKEKNFFLTYGDGLSNININNLYKFHLLKKKIITTTAVQYPSRFGILKFDGKKNFLVERFNEKSKNQFINGGFLVVSNKIFNFINNYQSSLEIDCIPKIVEKKQLVAYKHFGFWQCLDDINDKKKLDNFFKKNKYPWKK